MKTKLKILTAILLMAVLAITMLGCVSIKECNFAEQNLMKNAKVVYNAKNVKNAKSAIDGNNSSSAVLKEPKRGQIDYDLGAIVEFNTMILREKTDAVDCFRIYVKSEVGDKWQMVYEQDRITKYRLCYLENQKARYIRIDFVEVRGSVKLAEIELYNKTKTARDDFKVTQYLVMMEKNEVGEVTFSMKDVIGDAGFSGNYNVVTDVMIINGIGINKEGNVSFGSFTEQEFADNLADLRTIIGDRKVNIRLTMFVNPYKDNKQDSEFLDKNEDKIAKSIEDFVKKYDIYGIDYDWEYPQNQKQWSVYSQLIINTSNFTKVSVALPTWGISLSKKAINSIEIVNLMTYDLFDKRGDHSNIYVGGIDGIDKLLRAGFTKKQICLGIPTYARTVDGSNDAWPSLVNYPELGKWGNIVKDFEYKHKDKNYNKKEGITEVDTINTAFFNGYAMSRDKTALALASEIGGVMLFRARCDAPYTYQYSVHRAVEDVVKNYN